MTSRKAVFSKDRVYRYRLDIWWGKRLSRLNFLMLNPSTADEVENDPTVERCERRARMWGFDGVIITNLFAYRSTNPAALYPLTHDQRNGYNNLYHIIQGHLDSEGTIAGWGQHGELLGNRGRFIKGLFTRRGYILHYLKLAKDGTPYHPLYLPYELMPQVWE